MMYFSWNPGTVVDDTNKPLVAGRVTVYVHDSNVLADVYTLEGADYTAIDNPQLLDEAGRLSQTLFMELGVYDIKIEKANGDGTYDDFDVFEVGLDAKLQDINAVEVADVDALADLDPDVSSNVVTVTDEPRRQYIWDANSTDTPDGGIVVDSNVKGQGNWILLWDCPYLPSSIYGVKNGNYTNMSALLSYSPTVGSFSLATPPIVRLLPGNYNSGLTYVSTKKIAFEPGAKFTGTMMVPCDIEVFGDNGDYIGNIEFTKLGCTAHSSWYPTVEQFWLSGAQYMMCDATNHFTATTIKYGIDLANKTVSGIGTLVSGYANGAKFVVKANSCIPDGFFTVNDYVEISVDGFGDRIFRNGASWDPGLIVDGHHQQYNVAPDLDTFRNADNWVSTIVERKSRLGGIFNMNYVDLQGRTLSNGIALNASNGFIGVKNGTVNGLISVFGQYCNLYNVVGNLNINSNIGATVTMEKSNVVFQMAPTGLVQVVSRDSSIYLSGNPGIDVSETALDITGGTFQGFLGVTNPYVKSKNVVFKNVNFVGSTAWRLNRLFMNDCAGDVKIDLIPYAENGEYLYEIVFTNNMLLGSGRLWFTGVFSQAAPMADMAGNVKFGICNIVNNAFYGGAGGIKMLREHPYTFTHFMNYTVGPWTYENNYGDCPIVKPLRISNSTTFSQEKKTTGLSVEWLISDNTFNAWAPYQNVLAQGVPEPAQAGDGVDDSMAEVVDSVGGTSEPHNIVYGWSCGLTSPSDLMDEDQNNQFTEYLCLTWDLAVINVPNGITRFP